MLDDTATEDYPVNLQADNVHCQTYQVDYLKRNLSNIRSGHNFSIVHFNSRSLACHYDDFIVLLDHLRWHPDIIVSTETWFSDDTCADIPGYNSYHVYRTDRRGGGVSIYVGDHLESHQVEELSYISETLEVNTVKLTLNPRLTVQVVGVYRPHQNVIVFNNQISHIIANIPRSTLAYFVGDMNLDLFTPNILMEEYCAGKCLVLTGH